MRATQAWLDKHYASHHWHSGSFAAEQRVRPSVFAQHTVDRGGGRVGEENSLARPHTSNPSW